MVGKLQLEMDESFVNELKKVVEAAVKPLADELAELKAKIAVAANSEELTWDKAQVARYLRKGKSTVNRYMNKFDDFPKPKFNNHKNVWDKAEIIAWAEKHKDEI